jgi:hypothetical protein
MPYIFETLCITYEKEQHGSKHTVIKLPLCLIRHQAMKIYGGVGV